MIWRHCAQCASVASNDVGVLTSWSVSVAGRSVRTAVQEMGATKVSSRTKRHARTEVASLRILLTSQLLSIAAVIIFTQPILNKYMYRTLNVRDIFLEAFVFNKMFFFLFSEVLSSILMGHHLRSPIAFSVHNDDVSQGIGAHNIVRFPNIYTNAGEFFSY